MEKLDSITVAVKYCGGCNPYYDAAKATGSVEARLGIRLSVFDSENLPDICLLVKQCRSDCLAQSEQWSRSRTVLLESADAVKDAAREIKRAMENIISKEQRSDRL